MREKARKMGWGRLPGWIVTLSSRQERSVKESSSLLLRGPFLAQ